MPIMLVTGHSSANLRRRAAAAGVSIIEKPFLGRQLVDGLRRAFAEHDAQHGGQPPRES
jgi:FixJ family two-component response regulator